MRFIILALSLLILLSCKEAKTGIDSTKSEKQTTLNTSPRHHEWVQFTRENGTTAEAFVVYPESETATDAIILIHENRGLNDWARSFADQLASAGYLVIAPDLLSNTVEGIARTSDFEDANAARDALYKLPAEQVMQDLSKAFEHIKKDPSSTQKVSVIGFCWGGSQTWKFSLEHANIHKSLVFYGTAPKDSSLFTQLSAPVYGFYGGTDNRVNATIEATEKAMKEANKDFDYVVYEGAGHAFMRRAASEQNSNDPNVIAANQAWERLLEILSN